MVFGKEVDDALRDQFADPIDCEHILIGFRLMIGGGDCSTAKGLERSIGIGEKPRIGLADMTHAERVYEAGERRGAEAALGRLLPKD